MFVSFMFSLSAGVLLCWFAIWDSTAAHFVEQVNFDILRRLSVDCCFCLFLLNTFTTSDTTSMSATLTLNRISVKSVKRKKESCLFGCECWMVLVYRGSLVKQSLKSGVKDFSVMQFSFDCWHTDTFSLAESDGSCQNDSTSCDTDALSFCQL